MPIVSQFTIGMSGTDMVDTLNDMKTSGIGTPLTVSNTDFSDTTNIYIGGTVGATATAWKVVKYIRASGLQYTATITNNSGYANIAAAWTARTSLTYVAS